MKRTPGFTLIELMVVVAIIGVLLAVITPQVGKAVYRARVSATALSIRNFKMGMDMLVNDIGHKPSLSGNANVAGDGLALRKRGSCPAAYQSIWNGPYVQSYPTQSVSSLFYYPNDFWYYYSWPGGGEGYVWYDWCGMGTGVLLHTPFISTKARLDVETVLIGRGNPDTNTNWMYYCGFHDDVAPW